MAYNARGQSYLKNIYIYIRISPLAYLHIQAHAVKTQFSHAGLSPA